MHREIEMVQYECNNVGGEEECELTANLLNAFIMPWEWGRVFASDDSDIWHRIIDVLVLWEQSLWLGFFPFKFCASALKKDIADP